MQNVGYIMAILSILLLALDRILKRKSVLSLAGSFLGLLSAVVFVMTPDVASLLFLASQGTVFILLFLVMTKPHLKLPYPVKYLPAVMFLATVPVFGIRQGFPLEAVIPAAIIIAVAYLLIGHGWIEAPKKPEAPKNETAPAGQTSSQYKKDLLPHALLLFFTFGIYQYIWIFKMTLCTNTCQKEPGRNPVTELLLCIFIPFYSVYWFYITAKRVDKLSRPQGGSSDLPVFCLVTAIIMSVVPAVVLQDRVNQISERRR